MNRYRFFSIKLIKASFLSASILFLSIVLFAPSSDSKALAMSRQTSSGSFEIYKKHCAQCHGIDGRARTAKGKRLGATDFTSTDWNTDEARAIRIITNGKSEMPSFKGKLSPGEIKSSWAYVRRFR